MFLTLEHPLIAHKIGILRDETTPPKLFRELAYEITLLLAFEATKGLAMSEYEITTPMEKAAAQKVAQSEVVLVPILRAGLGMLDAMLTLLPNARVGHVGMYRDHETLQPVPYYLNLPPEVEGNTAILLDPMLATGGSGAAAIGQLKQAGIDKVIFMCLIAAPEGIDALQSAYPNVEIYAGALDRELNQIGYILPGLGDAGDRLFATGQTAPKI